MLRLSLRMVGLLALAGAFAAAIIDGARTLADQRLEMTPLGETLSFILRDKFTALPALVSRINPKLWDPVLLSALYVPTCIVLVVLGVVLMLLTRAPPDPGVIGRRR